MIKYTFIFEDEERVSFMVDEVGGGIVDEDPGHGPADEWLDLEPFRCAECTLPKDKSSVCSAALSISPVLKAFGKRLSHEKVRLIVDRYESTLEMNTVTQRAVRSLMGLLLPLSACPVMKRLRPMARFHLPLASREHIAFRFLATHFIGQYLRRERGLPHQFELKELMDLLGTIRRVNRKLADRIRAATKQDAAVNALIILDAMADAIELNIETELKLLEPIFESYLDDKEPKTD